MMLVNDDNDRRYDGRKEDPPEPRELSLSETLAHFGFSTRPAGESCRDILAGEAVVLANSTASQVWEWLGVTGRIRTGAPELADAMDGRR